MPPATCEAPRDESVARESSQYLEEEESPEFGSSDSDSEDDDSSTVVRSPSRLTYSINHLSESTQNAVRGAFREPPRIALEKCRRIDDTYAFQMTELVTRSIRIRAPEDGNSQLTCSCGQGGEPCEHLLWLLDQVVKQTVYEQDSTKPLNMTESGFPSELGDPFQSISNHHLDLLADGIHCRVVTPDSEYDDELDSRRIQDSRELLSSVYGVSAEDYRPDIFTNPVGKDILRQQDLDYSVFRMLLDNHHFFHYFLSLSRETDFLKDQFRKYSQRVDHILSILDSYSASLATSDPYISGETPPDVTWAAAHIVGTIDLVKSELYHRQRPLRVSQAISAARSLVHILESVVARNRDAHPGPSRVARNLYLCLVGDRDRSFVIDALELLPEAASQFLPALEAALESLQVNGAPATYVDKFHKLLARLRTSSIGGGLKRAGQSERTDREPKRMK